MQEHTPAQTDTESATQSAFDLDDSAMSNLTGFFDVLIQMDLADKRKQRDEEKKKMNQPQQKVRNDSN